MVGRGLRVAPGKDHCLVLDFAGNIPRLGTIDELNIDDKGKVKQLGGIGAPVRECPKCNLYIPIRLTVCSGCGYAFPEKVKLQLVASEGQLIGGNKAKPKWYNVDRVIANVHRKKGSPPSVKLSYVCGIRVFAEWLCIEHPHRVGEIGRRKLLNRWAEADPPTTAAEVCKHQRLFKVPKRIEVSEAGQHPAILTREY
jgi:DNA repair protein RadD